MKEKNAKFCPDCEQNKSHHTDNWFNEIISHFFIPKYFVYLSQKFNNKIDAWLEKIFLVWEDNYFAEPDLQELKLRTKIFIEEARKHGATVDVLMNKYKQTNNFKMIIDDKVVRFSSLPLAEHKNGKLFHQIDDKLKCKKFLSKNNFPVPAGRGFWFWQKKKALRFGQQIGFPLVVKPRFGSVSRHVTTNIQNEAELMSAIKHALEYAPTFLVEKYLAQGFVHRITIIDHEKVFCAKQIPAFVVGNGFFTVQQLIDEKNLAVRRDGTFYYPLVPSKEINLTKILDNKEKLYIQKNPFMKLGGDIEELTSQINKKNIFLFKKLSRILNLKVFGLDFICEDISKPFHKQACGILEINTLPCIEMHHLPSVGRGQNPAKEIYNLTKKYYL